MPEPVLTNLSRDDVQLLRELVGWYRTSRRNRGAPLDDRTDLSKAPEVYVGRTPPGGIPGLVEYTGTSPDEPGSAETQIFTIQEQSVGEYRLLPIHGLTKRVFNLSKSDLPGNAWCPVWRTKSGHWITTGGDIEDAIVATGTGTGTAPDDAPTIASCGEGCGWVAGLEISWCLRLQVIDARGACIALDRTQDLELRHLNGKTWQSQSWVDATSGTCQGGNWDVKKFRYPGGEGVVLFWVDGHDPHLSIDGVELVLDCCGPNTARFSGGPLLGLCSGTPPTTPCADNTFSVLVSCRCCSISGWQGEGWYCVNIGTGTGTDCVNANCDPLFLTDADADRCDEDIEICSGPYATRALAQADCNPAVTLSCCLSDPVDDTLLATVSTGETFNLVFDPSDNFFKGSKVMACGNTLHLRFSSTLCSISYSCNGTTFTPGSGGTNVCSPFSSGPWTIDYGTVGIGCTTCTGTVTVTLTNP